jgi:ABC-type molybdate transport system substrate-binding protein
MKRQWRNIGFSLIDGGIMSVALGLALVLVVVDAAAVNASAIRVLGVTATGLKAMMEQLTPEFERRTTHEVVVTFGLVPELGKRIGDGEAVDVILNSWVKSGGSHEMLADLFGRREDCRQRSAPRP